MDGFPAPRALRAIFTLLLTTASLVVASGAAPADAALPVQGLYDQCSPAASGDACASRLAQMGSAGFGAVLNYTSWDASPDQLVAFADAAAAAGVQVIWPLNHQVWRQDGDITRVDPKLAAACGCSAAHDLLAYVVGLIGSHRATWGWYVGDELPATELPAVQALVARVKALDPSHPTLYVAYEQSGTAGANLTPFALAADWVGGAIYPYGTGADPGPQLNLVSSLVRTIVGARKRVMVLQAFDWGQHPDEVTMPGGFPDEQQMQASRDAALTSDPSLLLWYSFNDIQKSNDPARHWADLTAAAFAPEPTVTAVPTPGTTASVAATPKPKATKKKAVKKKKKAKKKKKKKVKKKKAKAATRKAASGRR